MTKRPVVELFAMAGVNSIRSYSGLLRKISTDDSLTFDLSLVRSLSRVYSARQEREYGLFGPCSSRSSVEILQ